MHKSFKVIDETYLPDENQDAFCGTLNECEEFLKLQDYHFAYKIVPHTKSELAFLREIERQELLKFLEENE